MNNFLSLLILIVFLVSGCQKSGCFENEGLKTTTQRTATRFNQIHVFDNIDVVLTQDSIEKISVEAGQYLQPNITTTIQKGVLILHNKTTCKWLRNPGVKVTVYVSLQKLNYLNYQGSGNVTSSNTLQTDSLSIYSEQGAGKVELTLNAKTVNTNIQHESPDFILHGKSDVCYSYVDSRGTIDFSDFEVNYLGIGYTSVRNATVNVTGGMDAVIYHTGNLYVKGNPNRIGTNYYSTGRVIPLP